MSFSYSLMLVCVSDLSSSRRSTILCPSNPPRALTSSTHCLIELAERPAGSAYWPVWEIAPPMSTSLFGRWLLQAGAGQSARMVIRAPARVGIAGIIISSSLRVRSVMLRVRVNPALLEPRIESVAEAIAEQVEAEHGDENREPGEESQPRVGLDEGDVGLEVPSPARRRRLSAQPEEGERRLHDDGGRDAERGRDDDRRQTVGQDVPEQDPGIPHSEGAAGLDVLLLLDREHASPHQARVDGDAHDGDG